MQFTMEIPAPGDIVIESQAGDHAGIREVKVAYRTETGQIVTYAGGRYDMTGYPVTRTGANDIKSLWHLVEDTPARRERIERHQLVHLFQHTMWGRLPTDKLRQIHAMITEHIADLSH